MNFFVTGVGGQLGHDVMNELLKRGHEGVGSDIQETYSGVADGSAVTKAPYVALDITDKEAVEKVITEVNPDAVIHCAAWTAVDMAEDDDKVAKVRAINAGGTQNIADKSLLHGCGLSSKGLPPSSCPAFFSCWTSICFLSRGQIYSCGLHSKS